MAMVSVWIDCVLGAHACAFDTTVHISVYTVAEELGDSGRGGAGPLHE